MNKGWTEIIYNSKAKQKKNLDAIKILAWDSMYKAHHEDSFNNVEDYPTSALDMNTSKLFLKRINDLYPDSAFICISHNLDVIKSFDKVLELKDGNLNVIK